MHRCRERIVVALSTAHSPRSWCAGTGCRGAASAASSPTPARSGCPVHDLDAGRVHKETRQQVPRRLFARCEIRWRAAWSSRRRVSPRVTLGSKLAGDGARSCVRVTPRREASMRPRGRPMKPWPPVTRHTRGRQGTWTEEAEQVLPRDAPPHCCGVRTRRWSDPRPRSTRSMSGPPSGAQAQVHCRA